MIEVQLLGPFRVELDGHEVDLGTPKQVALAAALAVRSPAVVSRDRLIDDLWGEDPPSSAGSTFAGYLSNLRRAIEPNRSRGSEPTVIVTRRPGYVLEVPADAIDLHRFRALVARASSSASDGGAVEQLDDALALVRGPVLADVRGEFSMANIATQIDEEVLQARELRFELMVREGVARPAQIEAVVADHPLRERLRGLLARALYQDGRQAEALGALAETRAMMLEELGLEPGPELQSLETDILNHAPSLRPGRSPEPVAPINPNSAGAPLEAHRQSDPVVGRGREMAMIAQAFDDLDDGRGTLMVISGDTGTGKSHLALQIVDEAKRRGAVTGSGIYTDAAGRPPLSAWNDARRAIADQLGDRLFEITPPELIVSALEFVGGDIRGTFTDEVLSSPEELQRFLDIMRSSAVHMSKHEKLVILLDDFHWADEVSLAAIESWGRGVEESAILLVVTYRHDEFLKLPNSARWLRAISGAPRTVRLDLGGLDERGVRDLAALCGLDGLTASQISELESRTGGNPLFVTHLCRLSVETGTPVLSANLPDEVLAVVKERLSQLSPDLVAVLATASLAESSISPEIDADVLELDPDDVDDRMLEAVAEGLVVHDTSTPGNYRFANALVRETLSTTIGPRRRARLHARLGEALLTRFPSDPTVTIAAARHFCLGARAGTAQKGAALALQAGQQSIESFGHSTAYSILSMGLHALTFEREPDPSQRLELLKWRGRAGQALGEHDGALSDLLEAFRLAMALDDPVAATEVALVVREGTGLLRATSSWNPGPTALSMLSDAIGGLRSKPETQASRPALLADVLSAQAADGIAGSSLSTPDVAHLEALSSEAEGLVADHDGRVLSEVLLRRCFTTWLTTAPADQLNHLDRVVDVSVEHGHMEVELMARALACTAEIELGETERARERLAVGDERALRLGCPPSRNMLAGMPRVLLSATGRSVDAEASALGEIDGLRAAGPTLTDDLCTAVICSRFIRGDMEGALDEDMWSGLSLTNRPSTASTRALIYAEVGNLADARSALDVFEHRAHVQTETSRYTGLGWAAALAVRSLLGDVAEARELYERLSVMVGRLIIPGPGLFYVLPADFFLGLGALTLDLDAEAEGHFSTATKWAERVGSWETLKHIERVA